MAGRPKVTTKTNNIETTKTEEIVAKSETVEVTKPVAKPKIEKISIPLNYDIPIKSNVQGGLTYVSKKTGYEIKWEETGAIEYLEYQELVAMRNGQKKFFEDNWILIEDTDDYTAEQVYRSLNVDKYYVTASKFETLDDIFDLSVKEIKNVVPSLSNGYKENIASRAIELIRNNDERLDSSSKKSALEEVLGVKLAVDDI